MNTTLMTLFNHSVQGSQCTDLVHGFRMSIRERGAAIGRVRRVPGPGAVDGPTRAELVSWFLHVPLCGGSEH
jgi:hypothetical protein